MSEARATTKIDRHVSMRVRIRRTEQGYSQSELADQLGVTYQQVQKYEKGVNRISSGRLYQIADVLKVPVSFFFVGLDCTGSDDEASILSNLIHSSTGMSLAKVWSKLSQKERRSIFALAKSLTTPLTAKVHKPSRRASDGRPDDPFNGQRPVGEIST